MHRSGSRVPQVRGLALEPRESFGYGVEGLDSGDEVQGLGSRIERELGRDSGFGG